MEVGEQDLEYVKLNPICLDCGKRITAENANSHHEKCEQRYRFRASSMKRVEQRLVALSGDGLGALSMTRALPCRRAAPTNRESAFAAAASLMDSYHDR